MTRTVHTCLLIIGGAEDKVGRATILRRFVRLAGGRNARIVVIPTASSVPDETVDTYTTVFGRLGVPALAVVNPRSRQDAAGDALLRTMDDATGVFITGGNQLKLSQLFVGTPLADAISRAHQRGAVVAGTSAGASIMSQFMISLGADGVTPRQRSSHLRAGPAARGHHRPALRRAGPLRTADVAGGELARPAGDGHRRGHGRGGPGRPQADRGGLGCRFRG
jgi:cyanophycinase